MKKKKKILHIVQSAGGVERYIKMLIKYEKSNEYEHILICSRDYKKNYYIENNVEIEYVDMRRNISFFNDLKAIQQTRKMIKKYTPDIIYCHSSKAGAIGRLAGIGIEKKSIYNPHGWAFNMKCSKMKKNLYIWIEKTLAFLCDYIICISDAEKKSAIKYGICNDNKLIVIKNGIDVEEYSHNLACGKYKNSVIPDEAFVIGCVGRLDSQKAPDIFAKAAIEVKKVIPNAFFVFVGDGKLRSTIEELFQDNNMANSYLISGWVEEPMDYIVDFDIALLLSRWEGFGLVLPEYMIAEKPIVATKVDAIPEIITDQFNGLLVEADNVKEVVSAIRKLYLDDDIRSNIISNEISIVKKNFDVRRVAKEHQDLFKILE